MRRFNEYEPALAYHTDHGGWLLVMNEGYGVTTSEAIVQRLRDEAWVNRCEALQCWDETQIRRRRRG